MPLLQKVLKELWKCHKELGSSFFGIGLFGACARSFNTLADKDIHDSTKTFVRRSHHTHIALVVDSVCDPAS